MRSRFPNHARRFVIEPLESRRLLSGSTPFLGQPFNISTATINAVNFDNGGEGVAYHDTTPQNLGGAYRNTAVDIGAESSASNGYFLGWTAPGEWLNYTINVPTAGSYTLSARVASYKQGGTFHIEIDGTNVTGTMTVPNTGPWDTWQTITSQPFSLSAGTHVMKLAEDKGGYWGTIGDFDTFKFTPYTAAAPTPFLGRPFSVPSDRIEAENFDNGGEGISYHVPVPHNNVSGYRAATVGIGAETSASNGYMVGWTTAGEWLDYSLTVPAAGTFTFQAAVAAYMPGGTFHMEIDGVNVTGPMNVPNTGPWDTWQTISSPAFNLAAGPHLMRIVMDRGGYWGAVGDFDYFQFNATTAPATPHLTWQSAANSPVPRLEASAITVGNLMYVIGGYNESSPNWLAAKETDAYDPTTNTWTRLADMPEGLTHIGVATDGRYIYAAGGYVSNYSTGQQTFATGDVWRYDTQTNQWTAFVPLPQPRAAGALVILNGQLHYVDGTDQNRAARTDHWVLNLATTNPQWVSSTPLPFSRNHITADVLNGKIYVIGGQPLNDDTDPPADVLMWDPNNPSAWQTMASLPQARSHAVSDVVDGQIVVADGAGPGEQILSSVVAYDPITNTWSTVSDSLPAARLNPAGAIVDDRFVITTGYYSGLRQETWISQPL